METTKLYYEDAYLREFDAAVLSCREEQGRYLVVLDRTAFYPEGGGQPADHGVLGGVAVTDVQERDGVVCHTCAGPLAVGSTVHGAIDWQRPHAAALRGAYCQWDAVLRLPLRQCGLPHGDRCRDHRL